MKNNYRCRIGDTHNRARKQSLVRFNDRGVPSVDPRELLAQEKVQESINALEAIWKEAQGDS